MTTTSRKLSMATLLSQLKVWMIAIVGTVVVVFMLLFLAGLFQPKVLEESSQPRRLLPADVDVVQVQRVRRPRYESAVGSIEPIHQSSVAAKILAKVTEVNVTAGQAVKAGDILVRLSDEDLQSRLKQAEAAYQSAVAQTQQARSDYARASSLIQNNTISKAEFEMTSTNVRTSEAEVERAARAIDETRVFLDYATISAPFDGIVVDKQVQAGDTVSPGQVLLTLYDPNQMQLVANVRESLAVKLQVGQQVSAKLETFDHECLATVREVVPQADIGSRSFQVKVSGPCPPGIYSGMFGRILLPLEDEELITIPAKAVRRVGQLTLVDVVENNELIRRIVQLGRSLGNDFEVLSGLQPGEQIVVITSEGTH